MTRYTLEQYYRACKSGNSGVVNNIIDHVGIKNIETFDKSGYGLYAACKNGSPVFAHLLKIMVKYHSNIPYKEILYVACSYNRVGYVELLLKYKTESKDADKNARCLYISYAHGYTNCVKLLLSHFNYDMILLERALIVTCSIDHEETPDVTKDNVDMVNVLLHYIDFDEKILLHCLSLSDKFGFKKIYHVLMDVTKNIKKI